MSVIAFCLLSYRHDQPSGIGRGTAALMEGLRSLGHTALVIAANPRAANDELVDLVRLRSVRLPRPATHHDVLAALANPHPVVDEVQSILREHHVELACWADPLWGLGYLSPAPLDVTTALMVHKIRPADGERWQQALDHADLVCPASGYLLDQAATIGLDTRGWTVVPHALLDMASPTPFVSRENQRRHGPIRVVSRAEPAKGLADLIRAIPSSWNRPVELVLAEADVEAWPGMQGDVLAECHDAASQSDVVSILPALPWRRVPAFLSEAAATVIASTEPESFCYTAAEALSGGTPVVGFAAGNLPSLVGPAGRIVQLEAGHSALWEALSELLDDSAGYHEAAIAAPSRVSRCTPAGAARVLLDVAGIPTSPDPT